MTGAQVRKSRNRQIGAFGEATIAAYLQSRNFEIIDRNWRIKEGEIEILEVTPDIAPYLAAPERQKWWQDRVMQTWELIK